MTKTFIMALAATSLAIMGGVAVRAADTIIVDEPPVAVEQDVEGGGPGR